MSPLLGIYSIAKYMEYLKKHLNKYKKHLPKIFWIILILYALLRAFSVTNLNNEGFLHTYKYLTNDSFDWLYKWCLSIYL